MAYAIHIERRPEAGASSISLAEWEAVVERTEGVRLADGDAEAVNPRTGEVVRILNHGGDAEAFHPGDGSWRRIFYWNETRVSFRAPDDFLARECVARSLARELARALDARLVGDEGEIYD